MRAALLALVLALPALALEVRVLDMDEQVTVGKGISVEGTDLVVQVGDGQVKRIPCDTVVEITFPDNAPADQGKTPQVEVVLSNGDVVRGDVTDGNADTITLSAGEMGQMVLAESNLSRLVVLQDQNDKKVPADGAPDPKGSDKVYLTNGDSDVGFADKLTPEGIAFKSDRKNGDVVNYAWKDVAGWFFGGAQAVPMPSGLVATVDCAGGTRLTGTIDKVDGQTLTLNGIPFTVIGVTPPGFKGTFSLAGPDRIWVPLSMREQLTTGQLRQLIDNRRFRWVNMVGRLTPGVPLRQADAAMKTIASALEKQFPAANEGRTLEMALESDAALGINNRSQFVLAGGA